MNPHERRPQAARTSLGHLLEVDAVRHVMSATTVRVPKNASVRDVLATMRAERASAVLVEDAGRLAGIFTERDHLDKIAGDAGALARPVSEVMSADPKSVGPGDSLREVLRIAVEGGYRHLPVVDAAQVVGMITALDLVKFIAELFPTEVYNLPPHLNQVMPRAEGA